METNKNAKILKADFGEDYDGRVFVMKLHLVFGDRGHRIFNDFNLSNEGIGAFMRAIMKLTDSENWSEVEGKYVRVVEGTCGDQMAGSIVRFGHPLDDMWFDPYEVAKGLRKKE